MSKWWTCKRKRAYLVIDSAIQEAEAAKVRTQKTMVAYRCKYCNRYHIGHESKYCNNVIYKARYTVTEVETVVDTTRYEGIANQLTETLSDEQVQGIEKITIHFKAIEAGSARLSLDIEFDEVECDS